MLPLILLAVGQPNDLAYTPPSVATTPSMSHLVVRLAIMTGVGLAMCVALVWFMRRRWAAAVPQTSGPRRLKQVASLSLDRRASLHLLSIGTRKIVVGSDAAGMKAMVLLPESFANEVNQTGATPRLTDNIAERAFHIVRDADRARVRFEATLRDNQVG